MLAGLIVLCTVVLVDELDFKKIESSLPVIYVGYSLVRVRLLDDINHNTVYYHVRQDEKVDVGLIYEAEYEGKQQRVEVIEININPQEVLKDIYTLRTLTSNNSEKV